MTTAYCQLRERGRPGEWYRSGTPLLHTNERGETEGSGKQKQEGLSSLEGWVRAERGRRPPLGGCDKAAVKLLLLRSAKNCMRRMGLRSLLAQSAGGHNKVDAHAKQHNNQARPGDQALGAQLVRVACGHREGGAQEGLGGGQWADAASGWLASRVRRPPGQLWLAQKLCLPWGCKHARDCWSWDAGLLGSGSVPAGAVQLCP